MSTPQTRSADSAAHQHLYDVFLSHQSGDKPLVESIAARLVDERGLRPFLDKWHLIPGEPWQEALEDALDRSKTCVVFLGPGGLGPWENEEMRAALDERVRNKSFRVVPVLLPGAEPKDEKTLPRFLRRLTWVDFCGGLDDQEAFQRLVAGIRGLPPGRRQAPAIPNAPPASSVFGRFWKRLVAGKQPGERGELKKIIIGAVVALLLSTPFISAGIPRYKLQIKSPAFKKDGVYEAAAGAVVIKWGVTREQWFRETDISDTGLLRANLIIRSIGDAQEQGFLDQPGELKTNLKPGKYEVRIDATAYQRTETIALQVGGATQEMATLSGTVVEPNGQPIQGALVTLDDLPGMKPVETDSDGKFTIKDIPKPYGEEVKIRVIMDGYQPNPYTESNIVLGKRPPRITLTRKKK